MEIVLVGLNHRTAAVELRERVAFTPTQAREASDMLRSNAILDEVLIIATCNRSEIYGISESASFADIERFFASYHHVPHAELNHAFYRHSGFEAVRHLYRVASGLDSMLLGEAEVLGQVRDAYKIALERGTTGRLLNRVFQTSLEVGKKVRSETVLGVQPVSVAFAGVKLAEQILGDLKEKRALILGAGATSERAVGHLRSRGLQHMRLLNRTAKHAEDLSKKFGGEVMPWEAIQQTLVWPDLIVTSVSSPAPVLTHQMLADAMHARGSRPLFVIDLGVPRNVAANAADLKDVYVYNVDDLTLIVEQNKKAREAQIPRAEAIIEQQIDKFLRWRTAGAALDACVSYSGNSHTAQPQSATAWEVASGRN
jgi:glutamyl-tRNA reductase